MVLFLSTITDVAVLSVTANSVSGIRVVPLPIQDPADVTGSDVPGQGSTVSLRRLAISRAALTVCVLVYNSGDGINMVWYTRV